MGIAMALASSRPPHLVFDPETAAVMGMAFDLAITSLQDEGLPSIARELIARRIVKAAGEGERDPQQLATAAVKSLEIST
jgi:hypothetical protein